MDVIPPSDFAPVDWDALDRYLAGEESAVERERVERYIEGDPSLARLVRATRIPVDPASIAAPSAFAARVNAAIDAGDTVGRLRTPLSSSRFPWLTARWGYVAVAGVVLLAIGGLWPRMFQPEHAASVASYSTVAGEPRTITLDDGTAVTLAPASTLQVSGRTVSLVGEAFFSVTQQSKTPFLVRARETETRVLGTGFGVKAYPTDANVRVVVTEGRVSLRHRDAAESAGAILTQGYAAEWGRDGIRVWPQADTVVALAWRTGRLVFHDTPLEEVAKQLERWYGKSFIVADSMAAKQRVTANLNRGALSEVLDLITIPANVRYAIHDSQIVFSRR